MGGYQWSIYLIADWDTLGSAICEPDGGKGSVAEAPLPVRKMKQDVIVTCTFPNGAQYNYFYGSWAVACPDSPQVYSGDWPAIPPCTTAVDKPPATCPCAKAGNPINLATREKTQEEQDYQANEALAFTRFYSSNRTSAAFRQGWSHNFSKQLTSVRSGTIRAFHLSATGKQWWNGREWTPRVTLPLENTDTVTLARPDGSALYFVSTNHGASWHADSDVTFSLATSSNGAGDFTQFTLTTPERAIETYNQAGALVSVKLPSGKIQLLSYSDASTPADSAPGPGLLLAVSVNTRTIRFGYDAQRRMTLLTDPAGQVIAYDYDGLNNLVSVTYPDGHKRSYLYNEPAFDGAAGNPSFDHLLTGIEDELSAGNTVRFATFRYDAQGLPISTEHANGVSKYTFDYANNAITDPLGAVRSYDFQTTNGVKLITAISQAAGAGSAASARRISYLDSGNIAEDVDVNGVATAYRYESVRNLEITRYEAYRTPQMRTISTEWHPGYRLPLRIAEPLRRTTLTYFANGDLQTRTIEATTDASGAQGLAARVSGTPRTWSYTYNSEGQVLTIRGPRSDGADVTRFAYDAATGDLRAVTNALGQTTRLDDYDAHGNVGTIVAPTGRVTRLRYTARGWLASRTDTDGASSLVSTYTYDGVGTLRSATLPGQASRYFTYDDTRRLVGIADGVGNSISYTLDAMGNKTAERVNDPGGVLTRQVTRIHDQLGRIEQQTGTVQ